MMSIQDTESEQMLVCMFKHHQIIAAGRSGVNENRNELNT